MNKKNILIILGMLMLLCCMPLVNADCECSDFKDGDINILSKTMDVKTVFVDYQGYLYLMDFDNNQQVFKNSSSSVILKLKDLVGENGVRSVNLLYVLDCDSNCVLVDCYVSSIDIWFIFLAVFVGFFFGVILSLMFM